MAVVNTNNTPASIVSFFTRIRRDVCDRGRDLLRQGIAAKAHQRRVESIIAHHSQTHIHTHTHKKTQLSMSVRSVDCRGTLDGRLRPLPELIVAGRPCCSVGAPVTLSVQCVATQLAAPKHIHTQTYMYIYIHVHEAQTDFRICRLVYSCLLLESRYSSSLSIVCACVFVCV